MLSARTKQIYSYGKRRQRVINVDDRPAATPSIFDDIEPMPRAPIATKMKKREHAVHSNHGISSPKVIHVNRKKQSGPASDLKLARLVELLDGQTIKALPMAKPVLPSQQPIETPTRAPLAPFSLNVPGSPAVSGRLSRPKDFARRRPSKLKPVSSHIDVDIFVLDDDGTIIQQERRTQLDVQSNPTSQTNLKPLEKFVVDKIDGEELSQPRRPTRLGRRAVTTILSDSESESESENTLPVDRSSNAPTSSSIHTPTNPLPSLSLRRPTRLNRPASITTLSDSESENEAVASPVDRSSNAPTPSSSMPTPTSQPSLPCHSMGKVPRTSFDIVIPPAPYAIKRTTLGSVTTIKPPNHEPPRAPRYPPSSPPMARTRQLTPIQRRGGRNLFNPPSPSPSLTSTDLDLSLDLEDLTTMAGSIGLTAPHLPVPEIPDYLKPLLMECGQSGPFEFSSFVDTFPYDPVVHSLGGSSTDLKFRKVGEASYSEVFGIGDVVLKVIPLREPSDTKIRTRSTQTIDIGEGPAPSDVKDVLKEIIVTEAMGQVSDGFVKLLKAYIVRGKYPEVLLRLWDEYHNNKGSESVRPDTFLVSQMYAIIVLPNGGSDLEAYKFTHSSKVGWRQACSIFWQVAKTLAHAEQLVSFEHRDLHLGQILVKDLPTLVASPLRARSQNVRPKGKPSFVYMDDPAHGVRATLIDLGLSRMDAGDGNGGEEIHWTPLEEEVFMGEGDYQFDVYRMMKVYNGGAWEDFKPLTNVMAAAKLLKSKHLKAPAASRTSPTTDTAAFTEKNCYDCLVDIQEWLRTCVSTFAPASKAKGKGRPKKAQTVAAPSAGPACAGEIVAYGAKKGWIQATM
ncbi:hypothetical protein H0H92_001261 [Tricholoma furcatifolium]|nr:hypothetical protein H0H92_001261 [Tricholoma furcatifolium]